MMRNRPTAEELERILDEAENVAVAARSDVAKWARGTSDSETSDSHRIETLMVEAQYKYAEALRILRTGFLAEKHQYPKPAVPMHPDSIA